MHVSCFYKLLAQHNKFVSTQRDMQTEVPETFALVSSRWKRRLA